MATSLIELKNRTIADNGEVYFKHNFLTDLLLSGEDIIDIPYVEHHDITKYYRFKKITPMGWEDDGNFEGPNETSYKWSVDTSYNTRDICEKRLREINKHNTEYVTRLETELRLIDDRGMTEFFNTLCHIVETMRNNNVTWGAGRGSSCASLVLYLIGIHKVDPVKYDIPMQEFFK